MKILTSASKIAFLALMGTACTAFLYEVIAGRVTLEAKDFMVLASGAAAFYFAYKGEAKTPEPPVGTPPYAGK